MSASASSRQSAQMGEERCLVAVLLAPPAAPCGLTSATLPNPSIIVHAMRERGSRHSRHSRVILIFGSYRTFILHHFLSIGGRGVLSGVPIRLCGVACFGGVVCACLSVVLPAELCVRECVRLSREHLDIAAIRRRLAWGNGGRAATHGHSNELWQWSTAANAKPIQSCIR